jgi:hypothetical protein
MKAALTLTLTASLIASSLPATAQLPYWPPPGYRQPPQPTPPPQYTPPTPASSNWTRVRAIAPGSRISVTAIGLGDQEHQYFVSASDRTLTLLHVGELPRSAKRLAIKLAGSHPELFMLPGKWMEFSDGRVRANPDGLFVGRHKVADLSAIANTIDSGDVAQVAAFVMDDRPAPMHIDPGLAGAAAILPISALALACGDGGHCSSGVAWGVLLGVPIIVGVVHAIRADRRTRQEVIYRAY